jgi:myosin heavy subunit
MTAERDAATAARDAATAARDAAIADLAARTAELEDARVTIGTSAGEINTRQALVDAAREEVRILETQLAGIEDALRQADVRARALVNERDQAHLRSENLEAEMPELRRRAEDGRKRFDRITELTQQISDLEDQLTSLRTQAATSEEARVAAEVARVASEAARVAAVADADAANRARDDAIAAAASEALRVRNTAEEAARAADEALRNAMTRGDTSANEVSRLQAEADRAAAASAAARSAQAEAEARAEEAETARAAAVAAAAAATEAAATAAQEAAAAAEADKVALQQRAEAAETTRTEAVQAAETARTEAERLLSEKADLQTRLAAAGQGNEEVRAALVAAAAQQLAEVQNHLRAVEDESRAVHDRLGEAEAASRGRLGGEEVEALKSYIRTLAGTLGIDSSVEFEAVKQAITSMITNRNQRMVKLDRLLKLVWDGLKAFIARNRDNLETEIDLNDLPVDPNDSFIDSVHQKIGNLQVKQSPREDLLSPCLLNTLHYVLFSQLSEHCVEVLESLDLEGGESAIIAFFLNVVKLIKTNQYTIDLLNHGLEGFINDAIETNSAIFQAEHQTFLTAIGPVQAFIGQSNFFNFNLDTATHKLVPTLDRDSFVFKLSILFLAVFHNFVNSPENLERLHKAGCDYQIPHHVRLSVRAQIPPQQQGKPPMVLSSSYVPPESVAPPGKVRPSLAQSLGFGKK